MTDTSNSGFDLNRPTIIWILYLAGFVVGITALIGIVLAYVWAGEAHEPWEDTHYRYAIRTFWISIALAVAGVIISVITIGLGAFIVWPLIAIWFAVRSVRALLAAQRHEGVIGVESWLW